MDSVVKNILTKKSLYVFIGVIFASIILLLSATENPASSLFSNSKQDPQPNAEKVIKTAQELRDARTPVYPEGKACYAFYDYLEYNTEQDLSKKSLDEIKTEVKRIQEPVITELNQVQNNDFKKKFEDYFMMNDKYIEDLLKTGESNTEELAVSLDGISQACSTPEATETIAGKK